LAQLKTFCAEEMGLKRVNEKFLIKMVKNVACQKYIVSKELNNDEFESIVY